MCDTFGCKCGGKWAKKISVVYECSDCPAKFISVIDKPDCIPRSKIEAAIKELKTSVTKTMLRPKTKSRSRKVSELRGGIRNLNKLLEKK